MTKAKLVTRKKLDNPALDAAIQYGLQRVTAWTRNELAELQQHNALPICIPLSNGNYLVATRLVEKTPSCWKVGDIDFIDKRCAIFYCALTHMMKFAEADNMRRMDQLISKLDHDKLLFREKLDRAHTANDQFRIDLFSSRFEESKGKLARAKQDLEKTILRAKYIEVIS